jgi:hypothetical protein
MKCIGEAQQLQETGLDHHRLWQGKEAKAMLGDDFPG